MQQMQRTGATSAKLQTAFPLDHADEQKGRLENKALEKSKLGSVGGASQKAAQTDEHALYRYAVNHDLRAGLRALSELPLWIETDLRDHGTTLPGDVQLYMDMMRQNANSMMAIVDGLTALSKAGETPDEPHRSTVEQVTRQAWAELGEGANFKLDTTDALDTLFLPGKAVAALFKAVLGNTMHHHDLDKGHVIVTSEPDGDRVCIKIEDDGPGVPKSARTRVFAPLVMLRRRDETERAGLGLTLARKLVMKLGGTITISEASNGRGTAVHFDLPMRARW